MGLWAPKRLVASLLLVGLTSVASAAPMDLDVFTDFEEFIPNTVLGVPFDIGLTPERATFSGDALAGFLTISELYHSGVRAWMVAPSGTGTITFETNAAEVEFWARTRSFATGSTVITAFDDVGAVIDTVTLTAIDLFQLISFSGSIDHIDVVNNDSGFMNSIDDFGFTAIPEPSTFVLTAIGLFGLLAHGHRRHRA